MDQTKCDLILTKDGMEMLRLDNHESERVSILTSIADGENVYEVDLVELWLAMRDGSIGDIAFGPTA